jgi:hypothetical protein
LMCWFSPSYGFGRPPTQYSPLVVVCCGLQAICRFITGSLKEKNPNLDDEVWC